MELNMNILLGYPGAVVNCKSEADAKLLLKYLKTNYPEKVSNWRSNRTDWDVYGDQTVYHVYWDNPIRKMMYGSIGGSVHGRVFDFEELLFQIPDLQTELSDMPLTSLFV